MGKLQKGNRIDPWWARHQGDNQMIGNVDGKKKFAIINSKVEYDLKKLINVTRRFFQKKKCYKIMYLLTATI